MFNSKYDFGASIKKKYPQYANLDNTEVANKVLAIYPQYNDMIQAPGLIGGAFGQAKEILGQAWTGIKKAGSDIMDITDLQIDKPREQQGVIGKSISDIQKRASNVERLQAEMGLKGGFQPRAEFRRVGEFAGAASDVFGNIFSGAIETAVPKSLREQTGEVAKVAGRTKTGQEVISTAQTAFQKYQQFKQNNPELAKDIEAGGNIANFALNFVGVGGTGAIASKGDDFVRGVKTELETMVKQSAPKVASMADKAGTVAGKATTGATEAGLSFTTGISREAQQAIKQTPELYQSARKGAITREGVTEDVVSALKTRMNELSDLGKGYESVRKSPVTIQKSEIGKAVADFMKKKEISYIDLPVKDRKTIQQALDYVKEYGDTLTAKNALSLRSKLDDLASWGTEATDEGKRFIRVLRREIDTILGEKIPGLKALDAKYGPEREFIKKVKGMVLNADGTIKDNAISTIANLVGKNKEMKLARIEKLIPGFGDKVRALKAFEEIQNLGQIKTGAVARQIASFAFGGVPGFIATNPYVVGYALERYGFAKKYIQNLLKKGKNVSPEEIANVKKAINKMPKKEAEKVISQGGKNLLKEAPTPVKKATGTEPTPTLPILETSEAGPFVSADKSVSKQVLNTQTSTSVPSLPAPKINTAVTPTSKKVVSPSKKVNTPIIQKIAKKQETPKLPVKTVPKEILDEVAKYDNAEDFARGVLKNGVKETKAMEQAKVLRNKIEELKSKALGLDRNSAQFAKLDAEFGKLKKELDSIDADSPLEKILGKGEYDFEKNIETLKKFYNSNKTPNSKRALPMSQKSDVVYSKPIESVNGVRNLLKESGLQQYSNEGVGKLGQGRITGDFSVRDEVITTKSRLGKGYKIKTKSVPTGNIVIDGGNGMPLSENALSKIKTTLDNNGVKYVVENGTIKIKSGSKSALPLSSKTPVKYGKVDDLASEAKKYKSAEEFVKAIDSQGDKTLYSPQVGLKTETGKPVIIKGFHGTDKQFDKFILPKKGVRYTGDGVYFFPDKAPAEGYVAGRKGARVVESYLDLKNPYNMYLPQDNIDWQPGKERIREIIDKGHDSIIVRMKDIDSETGKVEADLINEIVVFDLDRIKTKDELIKAFNSVKK